MTTEDPDKDMQPTYSVVYCIDNDNIKMQNLRLKHATKGQKQTIQDYRSGKMNKNILVDLLRIIQRDMKRRIEHGTWEGDRDLWSKWHDYITDMIKTILEGGIK